MQFKTLVPDKTQLRSTTLGLMPSGPATLPEQSQDNSFLTFSVERDMEVQAVGAKTREGDNVHEMNCMLGKDDQQGEVCQAK